MPSGWARCSATSPPPSPGSTPRRALLRGTGSDQVHLLVVCTAERGLCGPFNSSIVRLAREQANTLMADGKEVKIFCVGTQGLRPASAQLREADRRARRASRRANSRLRARRGDRREDRAALRARRIRRLHAVLLALQVGDLADPDRAADHPAGVRERPKPGPAGGAAYEYEPDEEEILAELLPRNLAVQIFRALLENAASFYGAQMTAMDNATRNAGDMIQQADAHLQPHAPGDDHQGTDRDHLRRRGAVTRSAR